MSSRRESFRVAFVLAAFGLLSLLSMLARPSLATVRAVDIVHLIGTGMCLGGAIVAFAWARSK
ncbi:hypothetical protein FNZ56_06535 [Pseudoluteimonas lycopersici]|uniref:Uncharacterized protein n=1 Tax=Pseudoluteimonas lycopersici TaxID=1324796 RepID=A0A516V4V4_9GAMM|nr:hypothetical protein [Lysobacter lycopersici]QDQ73553.1 hypothetical protein FNZ56_06535 [Lysobacter lycopersici]